METKKDQVVLNHHKCLPESIPVVSADVILTVAYSAIPKVMLPLVTTINWKLLP